MSTKPVTFGACSDVTPRQLLNLLFLPDISCSELLFNLPKRKLVYYEKCTDRIILHVAFPLITMRPDSATSYSLHPVTVAALVLPALFFGFYRVASWLTDYARVQRLKRARIDAPVVNLGVDENYAAATQRYMSDFKGILQEGYDKYKDRAFQVWGIDGYVAILSPDCVEEMSALGPEVLDFHAASQRVSKFS